MMSNPPRFARQRAALLALSFVTMVGLLVGCSSNDGPPTGEVYGKVTLDGMPAPDGSITFVSQDGKMPTTGTEIKSGAYAATVPVGMVRVEIRMSKSTGKKKLYNTPDSPSQDVLTEILPERYHKNSELTVEVKRGNNEKDWDLKSK
jgi:hypothetical protein